MSCRKPHRRASAPSRPKLLAQEPREIGHLDRVPANILAVADAEIEPAHQLDDFLVQAADARFLRGLEAELADALVHLLLRLADDFLDPAGMDASVLDQLDERQLGHFPTDVVEGGDDDDARRIVDDHVDAGLFLKCPDVAPFAADDPALHFVVRNVDGRDGRFGGVRCGVPLNGHRQDFARLAVAIGFQFALILEDQRAGLVLQLPIEAFEQHLGRRLFVEGADFEELLLLLLEHALDLAFADFEGFGAVGELVLGQLEHPFFFADVLLLLVEKDLAAVEFAFEFPQFVAGSFAVPAPSTRGA